MSLKEKKILVIHGGVSDERQISLRSGKNIFSLLKEKYQTTSLDIKNKNTIHEYLKTNSPDIIYNALHGDFGEDGHLQGILTSYGIPFTGENVLASALAFDKLKTKEVIAGKSIPTPRYLTLYHLGQEWDKNIQQIISDIRSTKIGYPFFFKKSTSGSSKGVFLIENENQLLKILSIKTIQNNIKNYFIEEKINGKEITVGIYQDQTGAIKILPILVIKPQNKFYDFQAKYTAGLTDLSICTDLPTECYNSVCINAIRIYQIFNFQGCVRIDFFLDDDFCPYVLEINTQPGMTVTSDIPKMLTATTISLLDFIELQLAVALSQMK